MARDANRNERRGVGEMVAAMEPKEMQAYLLTHPLSRGGRLWCDRIIEGVNRGERTALRLFSEAMKWTGGQGNLVIAFVQALGVRDESELRALVDSGKRLEAMRQDAGASLADYRDEAVDLLRSILGNHPEWRAGVLAALSSGVVEQAEDVTGTNGGGGLGPA